MIIGRITCLAIISVAIVRAKSVAEFEEFIDQPLFFPQFLPNEQARIIQKRGEDYGTLDNNDYDIAVPPPFDYHQLDEPSQAQNEINIHIQHNDDNDHGGNENHSDEKKHDDEEGGGLSGFVKKIGKSATQSLSGKAEIVDTIVEKGKKIFGKK